MWFRKRRARRIAEVRRQLSELGTGTPPAQPQPMEYFDCGGRAHLVTTGTWLVAVHLRERRTAPTRSDYLFAPLLRGNSSRKTHR